MSPAAILAALTILLAPVGLLAPRGVVVLAALAVAAALTHRRVREEWRDLVQSPIGIGLGLLLAWMLVSCLWAPDPGRSLALWLTITAISVGGFALVAAGRAGGRRERPMLMTALMIAGVLFALLAIVEVTSGRAVTALVRGPTLPEALSRGAAILAILFVPIVVATWRRFGAALAFTLAVALAAALAALPMMAAILAAAAAVAVAATVNRWPIGGWRAVIGLSVAAVLVLPFVNLLIDPSGLSYAATGIPENWLHRVHIWRFAMTRFTEAPFFGWGLDAARALPGGSERVAQLLNVAPNLPLHPHNAAVQIWVELGLVGTLLATALLALVIAELRRSYTRDRFESAAAAGTFAAWLTIALLSFGLWQNWWLCVPWIVIALFRAVLPPHHVVDSDAP